MTLTHFWISILQNQSVGDLLSTSTAPNSNFSLAHSPEYLRHSPQADSTTLYARVQPSPPASQPGPLLRRLLTATDTNLLVTIVVPPRGLHPTAFLCASAGFMHSIPPYSPVLLTTALFTFNATQQEFCLLCDSCLW